MKFSHEKIHRAPEPSLRRRGQALLEYVLMIGLVSIITSLVTNFFIVKVWHKALGPGSGALYEQMMALMSN